MRLHLLDYTKQSYEEIAEDLQKQLLVHRQSLQNYIEMMEWTPTSGSEITLLIVSKIFNVTILVIRGDFLWLSHDVAPCDAQIILVQNCDGHFLGTKGMDGDVVVDVGEVPRYSVNKRQSPRLLETSAPKESRQNLSSMAVPDISPIVKSDGTSSIVNTDFSFNETSESTKRLRTEIKNLEQIPLDDKETTSGNNFAGQINSNAMFQKVAIKKPVV